MLIRRLLNYTLLLTTLFFTVNACAFGRRL